MSADVLRAHRVDVRPSEPGRLSIPQTPQETWDARVQRIFPHRCMGRLGFDCAVCRWVRDKWSGR